LPQYFPLLLLPLLPLPMPPRLTVDREADRSVWVLLHYR
jgi:hypothetical protein